MLDLWCFLVFFFPYIVLLVVVLILHSKQAKFHGHAVFFFKLKLNYVKLGLKWKARTYGFIFEKCGARDAIVNN